MATVRKCKIIGIRPVKYTRKATGEVVEGNEYYLSYQDPQINGVGAGRTFLRNGQYDKPLSAGGEIKVYHDDFRNTFAVIPD